jgi:tRNA/rRNA methyltransferase
MNNENNENNDYREMMTVANALIFVFVCPQMGENIGAAARIMGNFGLSNMVLVSPRDGWPNAKAEAVATHSRGIVDNARVCSSLGEAIQDCHFVFATSSKMRNINKPVMRPERASEKILNLCGVGGQNIAVVFGRESFGLTKEEMSYADAFITIPTVANTSLNIAHAVGIIAYELCRNRIISSDVNFDVNEISAIGTEDFGQCSGNIVDRSINFASVTKPKHSDFCPVSRCELEKLMTILVQLLEKKGFFRIPSKRKHTEEKIRGILIQSMYSGSQLRMIFGMLKSLVGKDIEV